MKRPSLYELMPSLYRRRDQEMLRAEGLFGTTADTPAAPLEAIFSILQTQFDRIEDAIAGLYDDWFVETCSMEALQLLAEPFDLSDMWLQERGADTRSLIANIVRYRQTKGTAAAFNGFASDATGWTVRVEDGILTQATTARLDDSAKPRSGFASLRKADIKRAPRSFNVGDTLHGTHSAHIHVWRARSVQIEDAQPWELPGDPRRRTFNAAGADVMLMRIDSEGAADAGTRATLPQTRQEARALVADPARLGFAVRDAVGPLAIRIEDLSEWADADTDFPVTTREAIVDPELGRFIVSDGRQLWVDYLPTTLDGIGSVPRSHPWGGSFDRTFVVIASHRASAPAGSAAERDIDERFDSFQAALDRAARLEPSETVRIVLGDSTTFRSAEGWTFSPADGRRNLTIETAPGARPTLLGTLAIRPGEASHISLRGLLIRGSVIAGEHAEIDIEHATIRAADVGQPSLLVEGAVLHQPAAAIRGSMVDAIKMGANRPLEISDSIIIGEMYSADGLRAQRVTFIEAVRVQEIAADDSVFNRGLRSGTAHTGYLRFCLIPPRAVTPVLFACIETAQQMLASCVVGRPRFARLHDDLPDSVRKGGSEGWEIGAFAHYAENTRIANLNRAIAEFLPDTVSARVEFRS